MLIQSFQFSSYWLKKKRLEIHWYNNVRFCRACSIPVDGRNLPAQSIRNRHCRYWFEIDIRCLTHKSENKK